MSNVIERARKIRPIIEKAVGGLDDATALKAVALYPKWKEGIELKAGERVRHADKLYKVKQDHTTQADWTPDITTSLFEEVREAEQGTIGDPIPYDGNMELFAGKYYIQNGVTYLCTRNTGTAVYHALSDLVGLYVEVSE